VHEVLCNYTARRLYMLNCKLILLTRWKCLLHNLVKLNIIDRHNMAMINWGWLYNLWITNKSNINLS